jgi:DMSO reductase anchor subunit
MLSAEYLFLALYFVLLYSLARKYKTDQDYKKQLLVWAIIQAILFVAFTALVYTMSKGFTTINGAVYLLSLFLAIGVTIRARKTVEVR